MKFDKDTMKAAFSKDKLRSRKFKHGGLATIVTVLFLAAVVIVNMIVGVLSQKFPLSADLTEKQSFALTDDSINFVKALTKNVDIYILNEENSFIANGDYYVQADNVIKQYAQHSDKVSVQYINTTKNPTFLSSFTSANEKPAANDIIVKCGDKHRIISSSDLFDTKTSYDNYYQQQTSITSSKAEQTVTSALLNVTSDTQVKVSVLTGYDEQDATSFTDLLKKNNYEVTEQALTTEEIDPEAKIAVIFAPGRDYDESGLKKLDTFLSNGEQLGKTVLYIASPEQTDMPNLNTFLQKWSIAVEDGLVVESSTGKLASNNPYYGLAEYVDETYSKAIKNTKISVFMPYSKPLKVLNTDRVKTLLQYSATSGICPSNADENWKLTTDKITGPIPVAVVSTQTKYKGTTPMISNVAVVGTYLAMDSSVLSQTSVNNSAYFINMFNTLAEREDTITIESKTIGGEELGITAAQANSLGITFTVVIPVLVLLAGLVIWIRRRNR